MNRLTSLELTCIELVAKNNWPMFRVDGLRAIRRENTGVGRYVHLEDELRQQLVDGVYGPESGRTVEMSGVEYGLDFVVDVSSGRINYLELVTSGNDGWDGVERDWRIA